MTTTPASFWKNRVVFVTGATGLLGSWLTRALLGRGARVVALVRDWVPESALLSSDDLHRVTVVRGDVCDGALLSRALCEYEIETVFHLAAQAIVGTARANPASTFEINVGGTWALLEAARKAPRVGQVLVASSDKAYGAHENLPYNEDTPLVGRHPYDCSKSCADLIAQSYAWTYGLPVGITRCGNLYGGGDLNWNRLIPGTIRSAIEGTAPIVRSDGLFTRDYLYVEDAALAYLRLAEGLAEGLAKPGAAFNFGHNQPVTVLDVVQRICEAAGRADLQPQVLGQASDEIRAQYLDSSRAYETLGWRPQWSFEEGLKRTLDWYRAFLSDASS
jgi:CDP-glucose 4,6-dehydratase